MVHSFINEVEALEHCDQEKGCDHVFGGTFFKRIGEEGFGGSFSEGRLMDTSDLKEKEKHASGGNFRGSFGGQRFVRPGGPGGPGEGTFGPGFVDARNFRQHRDRMIA